MRTYIRKKLQAQEIQDVQSLCRLCLGKTETMIPIFDTNANDLFGGLSLRITMCLGLEVSRGDAFPKLICQLCNTELEKFYTFKKSCAATYRTLKASIFTLKQNDNLKVNEFSHKDTTNMFGSSDKSNYSVIIDPSKNLGSELHQHSSMGSHLREKCIQQDNAIESSIQQGNAIQNSIQQGTAIQNCIQQDDTILGVNRIQNIAPVEERLVKDEYLQRPLLQQQSLCTNTNPHTSCSTVVGFGNDIQMGGGSHDDAGQAQDENKQQVDNVKITQYLPAEIVANLIQGGVLARRENSLEIMDQSVKTFALETPCGNEVVLELVEEDPYTPGDSYPNSSRPKIFDSNVSSDGRCCGACGARFPGRGALERHMRVHSGERPFACRACGRRFAQREVLRRHQLLHQDKLPYQCPRCPKSYTQRGALQAHMRAHAPPGARPLVLHRCTRCPKVFIYPSGLSRHMNVHQGRDYPCDACPRTFNDTSSLQRHRRTHHRRTR